MNIRVDSDGTTARLGRGLQPQSEPTRISPHLSLLPFRRRALNIVHGNRTPSHLENRVLHIRRWHARFLRFGCRGEQSGGLYRSRLIRS